MSGTTDRFADDGLPVDVVNRVAGAIANLARGEDFNFVRAARVALDAAGYAELYDKAAGVAGVVPGKANRDTILNTASQLVSGDRHDDYGDARTNFTRVAGMWSDLLGVQVAPWQVAWCMTALKLARVAHDPCKVDSWVDAAGYVALGGELAGSK